MASADARLQAFLRNRTAVVGAGAGVVLVFLAWRQLRAAQSPIVVAAPSSALGRAFTAMLLAVVVTGRHVKVQAAQE